MSTMSSSYDLIQLPHEIMLNHSSRLVTMPLLPHEIIDPGPSSSRSVASTPLMPSSGALQMIRLSISTKSQPQSAKLQISLCLQVDDENLNNINTQQHLDLHNLLAFPAAQEAINTMLLSNSSTSTTSDCNSKLLHRLLSSFVHQAALHVAARERDSEAAAGLGSLLRVSVLCRPPAAEKPEIMAETESTTDERELLPETCPVCLNDFEFSDGEEIISTPCFHVFHEECIGQWFQRGGRHCPLCRTSIIS